MQVAYEDSEGGFVFRSSLDGPELRAIVEGEVVGHELMLLASEMPWDPDEPRIVQIQVTRKAGVEISLRDANLRPALTACKEDRDRLGVALNAKTIEYDHLKALLAKVKAAGFDSDQDEWNQSPQVCFYCHAEWERAGHEDDCLWAEIERAAT